MKKFLRRTGLTVLIVLCSLSLAALHIGLYLFCGHSNEVWDVKLHSAPFGKLVLAVSYDNMYFEKMPYGVRRMEEGEEFSVGDGKIDPGVLGKYRIEILFIDTNRGERLYKHQTPSLTDGWWSAYDVKTLNPSLKGKFKMLVTEPDDSLLCIYIGSDEPFEIKEKDGFLYMPAGNLYIELER